jgi:hypothetical protein
MSIFASAQEYIQTSGIFLIVTQQFITCCWSKNKFSRLLPVNLPVNLWATAQEICQDVGGQTGNN